MVDLNIVALVQCPHPQGQSHFGRWGEQNSLLYITKMIFDHTLIIALVTILMVVVLIMNYKTYMYGNQSLIEL